MATGRHRVVVVGGGFGGLNVAHALAKSDVDVTIVDHDDVLGSCGSCPKWRSD